MSSQYYLRLPIKENNRYLDKLKYGNVTLPDPFNETLRQECFSTDLSNLPEVSQVQIFKYLVERECAYTREAFKAYRSLDAYNYFHSGKVQSILTYNNGNACMVYGEIEAGQTLSKRYSAWIVAAKTGEVQSGHCTCMAGNGEVCSHVATILVTVEQCVQDGLQRGPSVTSKPSVWSRVTKKADPQPVAQCDFLKPGKKMRVQAPLCLPLLNPDGSPKKLFKALKEVVPDCALFSVMCDSSETDTASESGSQDFASSQGEQDVEGEEPDVFSSLAQPHSEHGSTLSCPKCSAFYDAFIKLSPDQVVELERKTRQQSIEPLWHDARKLRITASTASKVPQRETTDPAKFLAEHLYPRFQGSAATRYGRESEGLAKEQIRERGCIVMDKGLVVCAGDPWLAASPDGIVDDKLLEVKCPITLSACTSFNDVFTATKQDIRVEDGKYIVNPKGPRGYYRQLQLGMHCLGLQASTLVIWTPLQHLELNVPYDSDFVTTYMQRLRRFYFTHMLPKVVDEFVEGRLQLCNDYMKMISKASQ